jgi:hypothetical protein
MPTDIKLKNSVTATNAPTSLQQGEVAINITDKKVWVGNAATTPVQLLGAGASGTFGALTVTSLTDSGNLTFTGTGNRITGDFSNATVANRVAFQTSTTNGNSIINVLPNGTGVNSDFRAFNNSDPTNSAFLSIGVVNAGTEARLNSSIAGTGTYLPMTFVTGGAERLRIDTSGNVGIGTSSPSVAAGLGLVLNGAGSQTRLAFKNTYTGDASTDGVQFALVNGTSAFIFQNRESDGTFAWETNSVERMRITSAGDVGIGTSSPAGAAGLALSITAGNTQARLTLKNTTTGDASTDGFQIGISTSGEALLDQRENLPMSFYTNATERMRIDSSGNLLVGRTSTTGNARFAMTTSSTSNLDYGFFVANSAGTRLIGVDNNGGFSTGVAAGSPYNATTGSAANVFINSDGVLLRSTSSLKYKTDVQDATHGLDEVMQLRPVTYKGKNDGELVFGGLIAEEVDAIGLKEFVQYAENGTPDALAYGNMVSLAFKAIQELKATVDAQAARIAALESN